MSGLEGLLTGQTLVKRYRIGEVIGRGGFAAVYRAEDERLGRPVAVKVITVATPDAEAAEQHRERFEREARAAASLPQHPNVVTVHDFGVDPVLGLDFLVMEFLHGEDLATRFRREGRPALPEALRILKEAVSGIAVGHRAGIVHRDVKPGNIFLARGEGADELRVCILDFGIARVVAEDQTLTGLPGEGTPLSPAYASPEQTRGIRDLTPASDVFSLGVVAYQLLTGEKPFAASPRVEPSDWVPRRRIRDLDPDAPTWLEALVLRALAYAPEDRFTDAEDFASALALQHDVDAGRAYPVAATAAEGSPGWDADRTLFQSEPENSPPRERQRLVVEERPVHRSRSPARAILIVLLLLGGGAAAWWFVGDDERPALDPSAVADLEVVSEELEEPAEGEETPEDRGTLSPAEGGSPSIRSPAVALPEIDTTLIDSVTAGAPADTLGGDTTPTPLPTQDGDSVIAPADTASPAPRLLGVPVDSVPAAARRLSRKAPTRPSPGGTRPRDPAPAGS